MAGKLRTRFTPMQKKHIMAPSPLQQALAALPTLSGERTRRNGFIRTQHSQGAGWISAVRPAPDLLNIPNPGRLLPPAQD